MKKEWFAAWFNSPYYHLLYNSHDELEAKFALDNLSRAMGLKPGSKLLDLACGKGRHARYLAEKGFQVTGIDLSPNSIRFARQFENENLEFYRHDMRKPFRANYFDAVLNMFTSFGYFDRPSDHVRTLANVAQGLRPGGQFLLDFFNAGHLKKNFVPQGTKTLSGITFSIKKWLRDGHVYKSIHFEAEGKTYHFREKVRMFELADFQSMMDVAGLKIQHIFGGYDCSAYEPAHSQRLILTAVKS